MKLWTGRVDAGEGELARRWHQLATPFAPACRQVSALPVLPATKACGAIRAVSARRLHRPSSARHWPIWPGIRLIRCAIWAMCL
jgi:hypothetical protein